MLQSDAFRSFIFIILAASLLFAYYIKKIEMKYAVGILVLLLLFDMWPVSKRFLSNDNFEKVLVKANPYPLTPKIKLFFRIIRLITSY